MSACCYDNLVYINCSLTLYQPPALVERIKYLLICNSLFFFLNQKFGLDNETINSNTIPVIIIGN